MSKQIWAIFLITTVCSSLTYAFQGPCMGDVNPEICQTTLDLIDAEIARAKKGDRKELVQLEKARKYLLEKEVSTSGRSVEKDPEKKPEEGGLEKETPDPTPPSRNEEVVKEEEGKEEKEEKEEKAPLGYAGRSRSADFSDFITISRYGSGLVAAEGLLLMAEGVVAALSTPVALAVLGVSAGIGLAAVISYWVKELGQFDSQTLDGVRDKRGFRARVADALAKLKKYGNQIEERLKDVSILAPAQLCSEGEAVSAPRVRPADTDKPSTSKCTNPTPFKQNSSSGGACEFVDDICSDPGKLQKKKQELYKDWMGQTRGNGSWEQEMLDNVCEVVQSLKKNNCLPEFYKPEDWFKKNAVRNPDGTFNLFKTKANHGLSKLGMGPKKFENIHRPTGKPYLDSSAKEFIELDASVSRPGRGAFRVIASGAGEVFLDLGHYSAKSLVYLLCK